MNNFEQFLTRFLLKEEQAEFDFEGDDKKKIEAERKAREKKQREDDKEHTRQVDSLEDSKKKKYRKRWKR